MLIDNLEKAQKYLFDYIPSDSIYKYPASFGLGRTQELLKLLGNPQNKIETIHIAGTSGKGSTAYFTSTILHSLGYKTGLTVSPHLVDIRERIQINNSFISENLFIQYLNDIIPSIMNITQTSFGKPTIFEILIALAFYVFWKEHVDFAVIETGLGGMYDATNTIDGKRKHVILTKIGLDHQNILGKTLNKIALQKAEIIKDNNVVISSPQHPHAKKIIMDIATKRHAELLFINNLQITNIKKLNNKTMFDFKFLNTKIPNIVINTPAFYQTQNASIAIALILKLAEKNIIKLNIPAMKKSLENSVFPGRFDVKKIHNKIVIIDGAHNPQKMSTFIQSLNHMYPDKKLHFFLSFKIGKNYSAMLRYIIPYASKITLTDFYVKDENLTNISEDPKYIKKILEKLNYKKSVITKNPVEAFNKVLSGKSPIIVITGSLYFLSVIYKELSRMEKNNTRV